MTDAMKLNTLRDERDDILASVEIRELVEAHLSRESGKRLLLPTIQRSLVWRNDQIINYWDTLLRGWFPGLMLVHGVRSSREHSYSAAGSLLLADVGDLELFDGQQRMAAILLGFGEGPLAKTHRLWAELSDTAPADGTPVYRLRITTVGQPFGYQAASPNNKLELDARRKRWDEWFGSNSDKMDADNAANLRKRLRALLGEGIELDASTGSEPAKLTTLLRELAFDLSMEGPNSGSATVFPLAPIARQALHAVFSHRPAVPGRTYEEWAASAIQETYSRQATEAVERFNKLHSTLESAGRLQNDLKISVELEIAVKKIGGDILTPENYQEFFKRVGQGGTALTEDELSYSLIKSAFPQARGTIEKITQDPDVGHLGSSTQIALAGLRLARIEAVSDAQAWQRVSKPNATWTQKLVTEGKASFDARHDLNPAQREGVYENFSAMISPGDNRSKPRLHQIMAAVRTLIAHDSRHTPTGFPKILLGRLPTGFVDLAVLFAGHSRLTVLDDAELKRSLLLWSVTFGEPEPFMRLVAERISELTDTGNLETDWFAAIIRELENGGKVLRVPSTNELDAAQQWSEGTSLENGYGRVFGWEERYQPANSEGRQISKSLNEMNFWSSKGKSALLWLQRQQIEDTFTHFDPTSDRDDDLPIDLDHIIAQDVFNFTWNANACPKAADDSKLDPDFAKQLREFRNGLGNTLGNLRWLCASENRRRGSGRGKSMDAVEGKFAAIEPDEFDLFNRLLEPLSTQSKGMADWSVDDLMRWQALVLTRTVRQVRRLVTESHMERLAPRP